MFNSIRHANTAEIETIYGGNQESLSKGGRLLLAPGSEQAVFAYNQQLLFLLRDLDPGLRAIDLTERLNTLVFCLRRF